MHNRDILATTRELLNSTDDSVAKQVLASAPNASLFDIAIAAPTAKLTVAAISSLCSSPSDSPTFPSDSIMANVMITQLQSDSSAVRAACLRRIGKDNWLNRSRLPNYLRQELMASIHQIVGCDPSWINRQEALQRMADANSPLVDLMTAASDPHWRVRNQLLDVLASRSTSLSELYSISKPHLSNPRIRGLVDYFALLEGICESRSKELPTDASFDGLAPNPYELLDDNDPAVVLRQLEELPQEEEINVLPWIPNLLIHADPRVSKKAGRILRRFAKAELLERLLPVLSDRRNFGVHTVLTTLRSLGTFQCQKTAELYMQSPIKESTPAALAWCVDQLALNQLGSQLDDLISLSLELQDCELELSLLHLLLRTHDGSVSSLNHEYKVLRRYAELLCRPALVSESRTCQCVGLELGTAFGILGSMEGWKNLQHSQFGSVRARFLRSANQNCDPINWRPFLDDAAAEVRKTMAELLVEPTGTAASLGPQQRAELLSRLQTDNHPSVRVASLDSSQAEAICLHPELESSWLVVQAAATRLAKPIWELTLDSAVPAPPPSPAANAQDDRPRPPTVALPRPGSAGFTEFGTERISVCRMGLSGHYHLPEVGFAQANDVGVNLMFWEPNYDSMTRYFRSISPTQRTHIHLVAGSFHATPTGIRRDVERTLRQLQIDQVRFFLSFWTRSWNRLREDVVRELEILRQEGKIGTYSLSTHNRQLALEAIQRGWNPVMVRHSMAHRGAEAEILPAAEAAGTSIITFNNTCYGRLLKAVGTWEPPTAAECYRYSLECSGVTLCLTAPSTVDQLQQNLTALSPTTEDDVRWQNLRSSFLEHGQEVYRRDRAFTKYVRSV